LRTAIANTTAPLTQEQKNGYLGLAKTGRVKLRGPEQGEWVRRLEVELDNLRAAAGWAVTQWSADEARAVLSSLERFFWAHSWHEGSETFAQLVDLLESSPGGSPDVGDASDVLLSALAYQTYLGSALGYDEKLDAIARACLPALSSWSYSPKASRRSD
jgi:hypothetical protein